MNALVMMCLGAGCGGSVFLLVQSLRPRPTPLHELFAALDGSGVVYGSGRSTPALPRPSLRSAITSFGLSVTHATTDLAQLNRDLAITRRSMEQHALTKVSGPGAVVLISYVLWLGVGLLGLPLPPFLVLAGGLVAGALAFIAPDVRLRRLAKSRRAGFRHALSAYLDLVTIIIAGGGGLNTSLTAAADAGDGWAFQEIRAALNTARLSNQTPWTTLGELAARFDVPELSDIVNSVTLAGEQGARIEESIAVKADVLRVHLQAEVEELAESRTEQMLIPVAVLLVALFLFVGFAVFHQLNGGNPQFIT